MLQQEVFKIKLKRALRRIRKIFPVTINNYVYFFKNGTHIETAETNYKISEFNARHKSKIKKVDRKLKGNSKCFRVYINKDIAHITWVYDQLLLARQLGERNVLTVGGSLTEEHFRNMGLFTNVLKFVASRAQHDLIMLVDPANISSIKAMESAGFKKKYRFIMIRIAGFKIWCKKYAV
ncbi:hypothetical protein BH11BAC6_BH11BAC6_08370 [soil metagenome]